MSEPRFSLTELVEASGISERTIRYYIGEGLLQHARGRGRSSYYTTEHLERLTRIADLRERGLSLAEIAESLVPAAQTIQTPTESWQRILLHPTLEMNVRSDAPEDIKLLVQRFQQIADQWFATLETGGQFDQH
ncbi:MAG: helix-turn-helix domain-containing protein [Thermomicrobiales bacterium]